MASEYMTGGEFLMEKVQNMHCFLRNEVFAHSLVLSELGERCRKKCMEWGIEKLIVMTAPLLKDIHPGEGKCRADMPAWGAFLDSRFKILMAMPNAMSELTQEQKQALEDYSWMNTDPEYLFKLYRYVCLFNNMLFPPEKEQQEEIPEDMKSSYS